MILYNSNAEFPFAKAKNTEERIWGDMEKSILFVSGFSEEDRLVASTLDTWFSNLTQAHFKGKKPGGFDLDHLKNQCRIRVLPMLKNPESDLRRNSTENEGKNKEKSFIEAQKSAVDLNRNFNTNWIRLKNSPTHRDKCGPFPESEGAVASFARRIKADTPSAAVILRHGKNALFYPPQATSKEQKEALFLGQYRSVPVYRAVDTDGTALQWLTDRGIKALELHQDETFLHRHGESLGNFLLMCAALT